MGVTGAGDGSSMCKAEGRWLQADCPIASVLTLLHRLALDSLAVGRGDGYDDNSGAMIQVSSTGSVVISNSTFNLAGTSISVAVGSTGEIWSSRFDLCHMANFESAISNAGVVGVTNSTFTGSGYGSTRNPRAIHTLPGGAVTITGATFDSFQAPYRDGAAFYFYF